MVEGVRLTLPCYLSAHQGTSQIDSLCPNSISSLWTRRRKVARYLGSLGPHHTPMPPAALGVPFPLHAPSEYTISTDVFLGAAILRV